MSTYVVDVLAGDCWCSSGGASSIDGPCGALELGCLCGELALNRVGVVMVELSLLNWSNVVVVVLSLDSCVLHWLNSGVVVVLVNLLVDGGGDLILVRPCDSLVGDCRSCGGVHLSVVLAVVTEEVLNCVLC